MMRQTQIPIPRLFQRLSVIVAAVCILGSTAPSVAESFCIKGDLTCETQPQRCDAGDITEAIDEALDLVDPLHCEADVTCDGEVNLVDVLCLIDCYFDEPSCLDTPCVGGIDLVGCERECRELLFASPPNVVSADECFRVQPAEDDEAHFFRAITGLLRVAEEQKDGDDPSTFTDSWKEMLDQLDVSENGRSIFDFTAQGPEDLPSDSPDGGDVQDFLTNVLVAGIDDAIEQLQMIEESFTTTITVAELTAIDVLGTSPIEVDYGDVKVFETGLHTWKFAMLTLLLGWDYDVDIDALQFEESVSILDLLGTYPSLLGLVANGDNMRGAGDALDAAINAYHAGSHFIRTEDQAPPPGVIELVTIDPTDLASEELVRVSLGEVQCSLQGLPLDSITDTGAEPWAVCGSAPPSICLQREPDGSCLEAEHIDASNLFADPFSLRSKLPPFTYDSLCETDTIVVPYPPPLQADDPFPDPTFNGTVPDQTQDSIALAFVPELEVWGWFSTFSPGETRSFFMENSSDSLAENITVTSIDLEIGTAFSLDLGGVTLPATGCEGDGLWIQVTFNPPGSGVFSDTLIVETDNPYVDDSFIQNPIQFQGEN